MFEKLKKTLLYGGMTREEFEEIRPDMQAQNMKNLRYYSAIMAVMFGILVIASFATGTFASANRVLYIVSCAGSVSLFLLSRQGEKRLDVASLLEALFILMVYFFSIKLSQQQSDKPSVTIMVIMVVIPLLFSNRPIMMDLSTLAVMIIYIFSIIMLKDPEWVPSDIWNTITFGVLAMIIAVIIIPVRLQGLQQQRKIAILSQTDLLTGLKNRNCYEQDVEAIGLTHAEDLACIYADVNGLHELNNTKGHKAGDIMLQAVAEEMRTQFGPEYTFRIGGDEFVAFTYSMSVEEIQKRIALLTEKLYQKGGYHISAGFAMSVDHEDDMSGLIKAAETKMYQAKQEYYQKTGNDRRCRRSTDRED